MSADKCQMPLYVQFAQQLGINLLSTDVSKLVRFAEQVAVRATLVEREECAKLCDARAKEHDGDTEEQNASECLAVAIRARRQS